MICSVVGLQYVDVLYELIGLAANILALTNGKQEVVREVIVYRIRVAECSQEFAVRIKDFVSHFRAPLLGSNKE